MYVHTFWQRHLVAKSKVNKTFIAPLSQEGQVDRANSEKNAGYEILEEKPTETQEATNIQPQMMGLRRDAIIMSTVKTLTTTMATANICYSHKSLHLDIAV